MEAILAEIKALTSDEDVVRDTFEGATDAEGVVDLLLRLSAQDEAMVKALQAEVAQLNKRKSRLNDRYEMARGLIARVLKMGNRKSMERPLGTPHFAKAAPALGDLVESKIPSDYWIEPPPELDRKRLLDDLKEGKKVAGAELAKDREIFKISRS